MMTAGAALDHEKRSTATRWWPLIPALLAFGVFLATLSPELGPGDAAELALQARRLGVTHPPGYPVHTFLGYLLNLVCDEPAQATNLLSACATSLAVGLLSAAALFFTRCFWTATLGPLFFAFAPTVWESAVSTEVYNVNACLVAIALWLTLRWYRHRTIGRAAATAFVAGLSCGTSLANALLIPGWLVLVWRRSRGRRSDLVTAALIAAVVGAAVLSWSIYRARTHPPLGTMLDPSRLADTWYYLAASEYRSIGSIPSSFYAERLLEHGKYFAASFLWVGIAFAVVGAWSLWRRHRKIAAATLLMFALNMVYFTWYPWRDYYEMVTPAYFLCSLWICLGIEFVRRRDAAGGATAMSRIVIAAAAALLLITGLRDHLSRQGQTPVTQFVERSFELFPENAVIIAHWDTFTPMLYFQQTHGLRQDLQLVERSERPRNYDWGTVGRWRTLVLVQIDTRPVFVDVPDLGLHQLCTLEPHSAPWFRVTSRRSQSKDDTEMP